MYINIETEFSNDLAGEGNKESYNFLSTQTLSIAIRFEEEESYKDERINYMKDIEWILAENEICFPNEIRSIDIRDKEIIIIFDLLICYWLTAELGSFMKRIKDISDHIYKWLESESIFDNTDVCMILNSRLV